MFLHNIGEHLNLFIISFWTISVRKSETNHMIERKFSFSPFIISYVTSGCSNIF
jgi:hypothetical protein